MLHGSGPAEGSALLICTTVGDAFQWVRHLPVEIAGLYGRFEALEKLIQRLAVLSPLHYLNYFKVPLLQLGCQFQTPERKDKSLFFLMSGCTTNYTFWSELNLSVMMADLTAGSSQEEEQGY